MSRQRIKQEIPKISERDLRIFRKLNAAGWLTTLQICNYFFPGRSLNAVSKRLRKLSAAKYIAIARVGSTQQALYRLAGQGKLALIEHSGLDEQDITIPNQLPRKVRHFTAINDLRFYFEQLSGSPNAELLFFFSERELYSYYQGTHTGSDVLIQLLRSYKIVPDAIARIRITKEGIVREVDLAIEYDSGTEHAAFFGRTKIKGYASLFAQNHERLEDFKVLTFTESIKRIISLMRQTIRYQPPHHLFYFATIEQLSPIGWEAEKIFLDPYDFFIPIRRADQIEVIEKEITGAGAAIPKEALVNLPATSPRRGSLREERERAYNYPEYTSLDANQ
ncbi:MAG TPA: replication-relaxation family protein [Blastocatellia bacterium]|nr:replication-relaxation family protein [Blastocatellia bacterium]